jgi:hypothetical protein
VGLLPDRRTDGLQVAKAKKPCARCCAVLQLTVMKTKLRVVGCRTPWWMRWRECLLGTVRLLRALLLVRSSSLPQPIDKKFLHTMLDEFSCRRVCPSARNCVCARARASVRAYVRVHACARQSACVRSAPFNVVLWAVQVRVLHMLHSDIVEDSWQAFLVFGLILGGSWTVMVFLAVGYCLRIHVGYPLQVGPPVRVRVCPSGLSVRPSVPPQKRLPIRRSCHSLVHDRSANP